MLNLRPCTRTLCKCVTPDQRGLWVDSKPFFCQDNCVVKMVKKNFRDSFCQGPKKRLVKFVAFIPFYPSPQFFRSQTFSNCFNPLAFLCPVHITQCKDGTISGHFGYAFEENSSRVIT